ncbi:MAG: ribonuclease J, partial [Chloroflexi bacterium]|nr:ribonuclease J [Chloroflexota bacterium]
MAQHPLRVIPLGGLGEIGKNMMALEYRREIIVIDAGVLFPEQDMLGVDLIIPNISYLIQNRDRVRAIFITHGHEDHTGALPYVLRDLKVPVYAPRLALGLISVKLKEHRNLRSAELVEAQPGKEIKAGPFRVDYFRVAHSIPDAMGLAIRTPLGLVIHTGDFKIDHTPVDGHPVSLAELARL